MNAGNSYRGAHQYEQAKVLYQQVLNSRATHLQALYNLGGLHLEMGEPTLAKDL